MSHSCGPQDGQPYRLKPVRCSLEAALRGATLKRLERLKHLGRRRLETGDRRQETGDWRREAGDGRRQTGDGRRQTADGRRQTADGRRQTEDRRQKTEDRRQKTGTGGRLHETRDGQRKA